MNEIPGGGTNPKKKTEYFRLLKGLTYAIGVLLLLVAVLVLLAGTGPVLRLAMPTVERSVSRSIDGSLTTGEIHGSLWTGLTLDSLALAMPATGLEVEAIGLELQWSPLALLRGEIHVDRLAAGKLAVMLPHSPGPESAPDEAEGPPILPFSLRLNQLDLPRIKIEDPKSGRRFLYTLSASGAVDKRAAKLALQLVPQGEDLDRLDVDFAFDADRRELHAAIDGRLHRTGIVMTLAGLPPEEATDIGISLKGEGPAEKWRGNLRVAAADLAELGGDLGLRLDSRRLGFTFTGTAAILGRLAARLPAQLQGTAGLGLNGSYEMDDGRLTFTRLELSKEDLLSLIAGADLDLAAGRLAMELQARIEPAASALLENTVQWQNLELSGKAAGDFSMPELDLNITGRSVAMPVVTSRELAIAIQTKTRGDRLGVEVKGTALGNGWTEAELATILGDRLDLALTAETAKDFKKTDIDKLEIAAAGLQLTGRGRFDDHGAGTAIALAADITDLEIFAPLAGMELKGAGRVAVKNGAWSPTGGGEADVEVTARELSLGQADLDRIVGPQPALAGRLEWSPRQELDLRLDRVDLAMADGTISLAFAEEFTRMRISGDLAVLPGALPPEAGVTMPQAARLTVNLEGPPQAPAGDITLTMQTLAAGREQFDAIAITSALQWSDENVLSVANRGDFIWHRKNYRLLADLTLPPDRLELSRLSLLGDGLEVAGQLELPDYQPPLRGTVSLKRLDAGLLQDWDAPLTAGQLDGKFDFLPEQAKQRIGLDLTAKGLRLTEAGGAMQDGIENLTLRGHVTDAFGEPALELQLSGTEIAYSQVLLTRLQATLRGPLGRLQATLETSGRLQATEPLPVSLSASAEMKLTEEMQVEVGKLTASLGTEKIALQRPMQVTRTAAGAVDGSAAITVGAKGLAEGSITLVPGKAFSAQADLSSIDLGPWDKMFAHQDMTGVLSLSATLNEQAGQATQARLSSMIDDIRHAQLAPVAGSSRLPPLALELEAGLGDGRLDGKLSFKGPELQVLAAEATLPLDVSFLAGQFGVDPRAPLSANVDIDGDIARFWPYVPLPDHSLAGRLMLKAAISGSIADPALEGTVRLADGRYEHLLFGTLLQDIRMEGRLDSRGVHIPVITANDGGKGSLTGKAEIDIGDRPSLGYRAELTMRDMALTRMDELRLTGDIDLNITGDDRTAAIRGAAKVNRGEVDLAVAFPPSVPQLEVENLPQPGEAADSKRRGRAKEEQEDEQEGFSADLHMTVDIPGRLFVRGKGLDSEWEGHLEISGPASDPRLVGELQARRGQLEVIGKTFVIRDSRITFLGGQPPDPQLDIVGIHASGGLEVTANVSGTASKTKLTLSSNPALPQDEILSRILFGKSQGKLSAYEAVQLAGVAAELTGTTEGFDILGSFRKLLRVDVLRVEGGEGGAGVEVGKYLTEGVYVGTKRGTTADTTGVEVEIEITPHIRATSESNEIDNKAGIQFKWDY